MGSKKVTTQQPKTAKKVYRKPVLSVFGDVRRLTRGQTGARIDGGSGMTKP